MFTLLWVSNEYPKCSITFLWRNEQNYSLIITKYPPYLFACVISTLFTWAGSDILSPWEKRWKEPRHEKTCLCHMWTTKVQVSLHIRRQVFSWRGSKYVSYFSRSTTKPTKSHTYAASQSESPVDTVDSKGPKGSSHIQQRLWSDCIVAQAELSFLWALICFVGFVVLWIILYCLINWDFFLNSL